MPVERYALERDGEERLEIRWTGNWKGIWRDLIITLNGEKVGAISNLRELKEGREFTLPDGSVLKLKLVQRFLTPELHVLRDGIPLPWSASDPVHRISVTYGVLFLLSGIFIVCGLLSELFEITLLEQFNFNYLSIIFGIHFLVFGLRVKKSSLFALLGAIGVLSYNGVVSIVLQTIRQTGNPFICLLFHVVFLMPLIRGIRAVRLSKK